MTSTLDSIGPSEKKKLEDYITAGVRVLSDITDLKEGLKENTKALAAEFGVKPAVLNKAVRMVFKSSFENEKDISDTIEDILTVTGHV